MALVEGEAGVGKTRLVSEVLGSSALSGHRQLVGYCHSVLEPFPFGPIVEALRGLENDLPSVSFSPVVGALRPLLPELAPQLPPLPQPFGGPAGERHRVFRALHEVFLALGPTVLSLEDLQWADPDTLELIEFVVQNPPPCLALILTYRREELPSGAAVLAVAARASAEVSRHVVSLSPLDREGVHALATELLAPAEVSEQLAERLYALTAGIPSALEEVIQLLLDHEQLPRRRGWTRGDLDSLGVPDALADSLRYRLALLGADARLLAETVAVLGAPASETLIGTVAGLSALRARAGLSRTLASGIVQEVGDGVFALRHILARRAVYEAMPSPERRALHRRAARGLMADREPRSQALVAHHFRKAGEVRLWLHWAERAAEAASSIGDDRGAAQLLEEALSTADVSVAVRARMAVKLGSAALFGRVPGRAIEILRELVEEHSLRPGIRGELRFSLARLLYQVGDSAGGYREMVRSAGELSRRPGPAARAMANLAATWPTEGGGDEDRSWLDRALAAEGRQNDPLVTTEVLASRAVVLLEAGDPAGWRAVEEIPWNASSPEQAVELVRACKYLAATATLLGHYGHAETFLESAYRLQKELGNERFGVGLATVQSELHWRTGRWEGLEGRARQLVDASSQARIMSGRNELVIGWLLLGRGELGEAERTFASALNAVRNARPGSSLIAAHAGLISIHLARKDISAAHTVASLGLETIRASGSWTLSQAVAPVIVEALLACREQAEASSLTTEFTRGLRGRDAPAGRAALAVCRGLLADAEGRSERAARSFAQAEGAWSRLPDRYQAARARERRGRCLLTLGDGPDCLFDALQDFETLGASWDAARTRAFLRMHRVVLPYPWRGGRRGYGGELTPRQREVVELASTGRTSPEIARALFLSPRTVESHIASAMRKLGVTSRRGLGVTSKRGRAGKDPEMGSNQNSVTPTDASSA